MINHPRQARDDDTANEPSGHIQDHFHLLEFDELASIANAGKMLAKIAWTMGTEEELDGELFTMLRGLQTEIERRSKLSNHEILEELHLRQKFRQKIHHWP